LYSNVVVKAIGRGSFGEIFEVRDGSGARFACKVEPKAGRDILKHEARVLKRLGGAPGVVEYVDSGTSDGVNWLLLELGGPSVSEMRKASGGSFPEATVANLGLRMLRALEETHARGYVHRDVKPGNFVLAEARGRSNDLLLIDFGTAGKPGSTSKTGRFYGTPKYASLRAHACEPLGPRDDLVSLGYFLAEAAAGALPWSELCLANASANKPRIAKVKAKFRGGKCARDVHPGFAEFLDAVDGDGERGRARGGKGGRGKIDVGETVLWSLRFFFFFFFFLFFSSLHFCV
jgi:casein kinase 1 alpha